MDGSAATRIGSLAISGLATLVALGWVWGLAVLVVHTLTFAFERWHYQRYFTLVPKLNDYSDEQLARMLWQYQVNVALIVAGYASPFAVMAFAPAPGPLVALLFSLSSLTVLAAQHTLTRHMSLFTLPVPILSAMLAAAHLTTGNWAILTTVLIAITGLNVFVMARSGHASVGRLIESQIRNEDATLALKAREEELLEASYTREALIAQLTEATKAAENATRRLTFLSDNTTDAIGLLGLAGRPVSMTKAIERILGISTEAFLKDPDAYLHPDDLTVALEIRSTFIDNPVPMTLTQRYRHADGHFVTLEARLNPVIDPETGQLRACVASYTDVTERNRQAEELRVAQERMAEQARQLKLMNDNGTDAVGIVDGGGKVLTVSQGITRILGFTAEYFLESPHDLVHPDDVMPTWEQFRAGWRSREAFRIRFRSKHADGRWVWLESRYRPVVDPETDKVSHAVFITSDIAEQRAYEEALENARQQAEAANIAKSQFLATMSHELRTPMSGVIGMLDLLLAEQLPDGQAEKARVARGSAENLLTILNDILDYSKLEGGHLTLEVLPTRLGALAEGVRALFEHEARRKGLALSLDLAEGLPAAVSIDPTRVRQIIINLLGNALKFTAQGSVGLRMGHDGQSLTIAVADTGIGIPEDVQARLFNRFVQADASTTRQYGGTGLGLAISRQLAELMGGTITVESTPGQGSTFTVTFPAPVAELASTQAAAGEVEDADDEIEIEPLRVLVAEDHPVNQRVVTALLQPWGHTVTVVGDGQQAVDAVQREAFDVVLMDIQMPVMDGPTAARTIRALPGAVANLPIIALTANAMEGDRERYLAAGMNDYVSKPIDPTSLILTMARVIRVRAAASGEHGASRAA